MTKFNFKANKNSTLTNTYINNIFVTLIQITFISIPFKQMMNDAHIRHAKKASIILDPNQNLLGAHDQNQDQDDDDYYEEDRTNNYQNDKQYQDGNISYPDQEEDSTNRYDEDAANKDQTGQNSKSSAEAQDKFEQQEYFEDNPKNVVLPDSLELKVSDKDFKKKIMAIIQQQQVANVGGIVFEDENEKPHQETGISEVFRCQRYDKRLSALKFLKLQDSGDIGEGGLVYALLKETQIWQELQQLHASYAHVATSTLHNVLYTQNAQIVIMLMEYLDKNLKQIMDSNLNEFKSRPEMLSSRHKMEQYHQITQKLIQKIMMDLLSSLFLMHLNGIYHMDIKPANIMYHQDIDKFVFIDFGAADYLHLSNDVHLNIQRSDLTAFTAEYCPPEILFEELDWQGNPIANPYAVDIWACGLILMELMFIYMLSEIHKRQASQPQDQTIIKRYEELRLLKAQAGYEFRNIPNQDIKRNEFYTFVENESKRMHINLSRDDITVDFIHNNMHFKGLNHLAQMLNRSIKDRITIYELAVDLNLPVLQKLIHPPPLKNFYRYMTFGEYNQLDPYGQHVSNTPDHDRDCIVYTNGSIYVGQLIKNEALQTVKRHGKGRLQIEIPFYQTPHLVIYEGLWENDLPVIPPEGIDIRLPIKIRDAVKWKGSKIVKVHLLKSADGELFATKLFGEDKMEVDLQKLRQKYKSETLSSLPLSNFFLKKPILPGQYILEATNLASLYEVKKVKEQALNQNAAQLVSYQLYCYDLLFGSKILQCITLQISFKNHANRESQGQSFQIVQKLQSNIILDQQNFYQFLTLLQKKNQHLRLSEIHYISLYILFIIKYMNFTQNSSGNKLQLNLTELNFPIQDLYDAQMINFCNCFVQGKSIKEINFSQSQQITDVSLNYIINYFNVQDIQKLILVGTSISNFFISGFASRFQISQLQEVDLSHCNKLRDGGINQFLQMKLDQLQSLKVNYTYFGSLSFRTLWTTGYFKNLQTLEFQGCSQLENPKDLIAIEPTQLLSLEKLNMQDCSGIDDILVNKILILRQTSLKKLRNLNISCNPHTDIDCLLQGLIDNPLDHLDISFTNLSNIHKLCGKLVGKNTEFLFRGLKIDQNFSNTVINAQSIANLDLSCIDIKDEQIIRSKIPVQAVDIRKLFIISCFNITKKFLGDLMMKNLQFLQELDLTASSCDDAVLRVICDNKYIKQLKSLNLSKCISLTDETIRIIGGSNFIKSLDTLDLSFTNISSQGLVYFERCEQWSAFKHFILKMCKNIRDDEKKSGVESLFKSPWLMYNLKTLDLSHIKDIKFPTLQLCMKHIANQRPFANQLISLHCCPALYKPQPLPIILKDFKSKLHQFKQVTSENLLALCECPQTSILLPNIKFDNIPELTDPVFTQILQSKSFKDKTESEIPGEQGQVINSIDLSFTKIGSMSIRLMADQKSISMNLKSLYLAGCKLGHIAIGRLIRNGFPQLILLDISQTKVSDEVFKKLSDKIVEKKLPELTQLHIEWCDFITKAGIIGFRDTQHNQIRNLIIKCQPH